jgi:hypothetical protein
LAATSALYPIAQWPSGVAIAAIDALRLAILSQFLGCCCALSAVD